MLLLGQIMVATLVIWGLAYLCVPLWFWTLAFIFSLFSLQWVGLLSAFVAFLLWVFGAGLLLLNIPTFRRKVLTDPCFKILRKILPAISRTEQDAIDAGEVWWEGQLFQGRPNWFTFLTFPQPKLSEEETRFLNSEVETLCSMLDDWAITQKLLDMTPETWNYLKTKGFFGMIIPKQYGGLGFSALASSTIVQKIATRSLTVAVSMMVPNSLGPAELLLAYGTEDQKNHYLPKLANGEEMPCFALTAPEAGSDASAIPDFGIVCRGTYQGQEILGMKLTWNKRYITLAPVATVLGLAFKLFDPEGLLGDQPELGITVCLLPTNHPGVHIGKRHFPLNQPFMNGPTHGTAVFAPLDWIIGGKPNIGKGWRMLVECLSAGRGVSLPALSTAAVKMCYRTTGAYALVRKQFNTSIGRFEGVEEALARIAGLTYILEATRLFTLGAIDNHIHPSVASAIAKYHMTELSRIVVNDAMDVHGGRGIMLGPKNYLGRCYESMPISITVEGANILTRSLIIFGQGVIRCHPYLRTEMAALWDKDEAQGLITFDKVFCAHIGYTLSNFARLLLHSFTAGRGLRVPNPLSEINVYVRQLTRMSIALSFTSDVILLCLGGKLKRRERLSARLGDILSNLYLASAVIKYYHDLGDKKHDLPHVKWALEFCLNRIQTAFLEFFRNFQWRIPALILRFLVFPWGWPFKKPLDSLDHRLATEMMSPTVFRDRLTQHCYMGNAENSIVARLDQALAAMIAAEPMLSKLEVVKKKNQHAVPKDMFMLISLALTEGIITEVEADLLREFEEARLDVIQVDEFTQAELQGR